MAKVLGLGGVFFKATNPAALTAWYRDVLGITPDEYGGVMFPHPDLGFTLLTPFKADTDYFGPSDKPFMINLIVDDLDGVIDRAKAAGAEPLGRQDEDYGRFAWLLDPNGTKIELWQPLGDSPV